MSSDIPQIHSKIDSQLNDKNPFVTSSVMLNPAFVPESSPAPDSSSLISDLGTSPQASTMTGNFGNAAVDIDLLEKEIAEKEQARREQQFISLSGDITSAPGARRSRTSEPSLETDFDTLNEPVWDTVKRDLHTIGTKFGHVLVPRDNRELLRNWDLWGPLFICVFISLLLQGGKEGKGLHFTEVFSLTFFGSCVVTLNIKLLGGHISFFQTLCVLGYCLLPPGAAALICKFIEISAPASSLMFFLRLFVAVAGFVWATHASTAFLTDSQPPKRKVLATYPVFLFYFVVSWMIISHPAL